MAVRQLWTQATEYNARDDRLLFEALLPYGPSGKIGIRLQGAVRSLGDLVLSMTGATTARISRGACFISWNNSVYCVVNDDNLNLNFAPAHATLARIDAVIAQVRDSEQGGTDSDPSIEVLTGQAATNPVAPGTPDGAYRLWTVRYNAGSNAPIVSDTRTGTPVVPSWRARRNQPVTTNAQGQFSLGFDQPFAPGSRDWICISCLDGDANGFTIRAVGVNQANINENGFTGWVRRVAGTGGAGSVYASATIRIIYLATDA